LWATALSPRPENDETEKYCVAPKSRSRGSGVCDQRLMARFPKGKITRAKRSAARRYLERAGYENQRELQNCTGQDQGQKWRCAQHEPRIDPKEDRPLEQHTDKKIEALLGFYCMGKKVIASGLTVKKNSYHAELETEQAGEIRATKIAREARRKTRDLDDTGAGKPKGFET
jgi:hypothetical protein